MNEKEFWRRVMMANEAGVKLEIVGGVPLWEFFPAKRHQMTIDRIRDSLKRKPPKRNGKAKCGCIHLSDVYIKFPDGSIKRPDISIFCREPDEEDEAITLVPEAVIEIVSPGYEAKDLEFAPHFYLSQGVKDVVIFDPETLLVLHVRKQGAQRRTSPLKLELECGCQVVI
jgi:hypothetical protein